VSKAEDLEKLVEERTRALRESEERYRQLVESAPDMIFAHREWSLIFVNPAGARLLGAADPGQLIGKPVLDIVHADYREIAKERIRRAYEGFPSAPMEQKYLRLDGTTVDVETITIPFTYQGKPAVQGICRNITERRKLEEMREAFISTVTHELQTPLVSIKGYIDYLLSGKLGPLSPQIQTAVEAVKRASDRLSHLTNDLLDYRRFVSGKLNLDLMPLDLTEVIDTCTKEIQPFIERKSQTLKLEVMKEALQVKGDHARLVQVIMNLLSNASKYTPEKGKITLTAEKKDGSIEVSITDTGIGIEEDDLARVFEPFATIKRPSYFKGTGLGLSVSKGLVEAHGGRIWAESEGEGKGAKFIFTVPRNTTS